MVFVTGGTGLVGSRLIFDLVSKGENVRALIRKDSGVLKFESLIKYYTKNPKQYSQKVDWVIGDVENIDDLYENITGGAKVYHCAAKVSFDPKEANEIIEANVQGTANIVNVCISNNIEKLCHVSSIGALGGKPINQYITEETSWSPVGKSAYSISKHNSELEVWRGIAEGLNAVIVNPAVILGAGNWSMGSPQLFSMAAKGMKFYTSGGTGYVDVCDVSKAMIMLMDSEISAERFLLSSENLKYKVLFENIAASVGQKAPSTLAGKYLTGIAYRLEKIRSLITRTKPKLTKQTHKISHTTSFYSGEKITKTLNFSYLPITKTINFIGKCYLEKV